MKEIDVTNLKEELQKNQNVLLIDVRTPAEFRSEHIPKSINIPLDKLSEHLNDIKKYNRVYIQCKTGGRSSRACSVLEEYNISNGFNVAGGIEAWKQAGFATITGRSRTIDINRQVMIIAGILVLTGTLGSLFFTNGLIWLAVIMGAGLLFAGISGFCGMAKLLEKAPWNQ